VDADEASGLRRVAGDTRRYRPDDSHSRTIDARRQVSRLRWSNDRQRLPFFSERRSDPFNPAAGARMRHRNTSS